MFLAFVLALAPADLVLHNGRIYTVDPAHPVVAALGEPKDFPTQDALSRALPDHPVVLTRVDGHAVLANARAMQLAGITAATKDPEGGRIVREPDGEPTGVFVDNAKELIERKVPPA